MIHLPYLLAKFNDNIEYKSEYDVDYIYHTGFYFINLLQTERLNLEGCYFVSLRASLMLFSHYVY